MPESTESAEPTDPTDPTAAADAADATVELRLVDDRGIRVRPGIAGQVRGVDADGDPLVPLGEPNSPIPGEDGADT